MKTEAENLKKSLSIDLVPLRAEHVARVLEIENCCFSQPWREGDFTRLIDNPDSVCLVALARGQVVGYSCCWIVFESAELGNIAVHPDYQCRSVGSRLLKKTVEICRRRRVAALFLEVRTSNRKAIELYELFGFARIGLRRGYYTKPVEDALIMKLVLH
ncbi:MAG: ribosomal protein S18-alanine N-acetyltransferase [Candidatus Glassbacteria bacterium]|nr:ribosomal protein S18-alanine N-acetyltransferase [Candidatus Glassbacteria bacterium]